MRKPCLHEQVLDSPVLGGKVLIREFTARQRVEMTEAANEEDPERPNQTLYRAMMIQYSVVDADSGTPYADGRLDRVTGLPAIDPRTRTPLFTIDEVVDLMDGRALPSQTLVDAISALSAVRPDALFPSNSATNGGERNPVAGAGTGGPGNERTEAGIPGADDHGASRPPAQSDGVGDDLGNVS